MKVLYSAILLPSFSLPFGPFSLSYANISGVTYFEYEDTFSLTRTYLTYTNVISKDATFKFITDVGKINSWNVNGILLNKRNGNNKH